jgi:hypothetical protein
MAINDDPVFISISWEVSIPTFRAVFSHSRPKAFADFKVRSKPLCSEHRHAERGTMKKYHKLNKTKELASYLEAVPQSSIENYLREA